MSTLILLLAAPPRLSRAPSAAQEAAAESAEFDFVLAADGQRILSQGRAGADRLPRATTVVAVLAPGDTAFQRLALPKAPPARLRAALAGAMEDALLEETADVHLALAPRARAGDTGWVAAVNRPWLKSRLDLLEGAGVPVDRVVPADEPSHTPGNTPGDTPGNTPRGHVLRRHGRLMLAWSDAQGAVCVPLAGSLARALVAAVPSDTLPHWSAVPDAAAEASQLAGVPVAASTDAEQALRALLSEWNLRQFDLAPRRRGTRRLREIGQRLAFGADWRVARLGLAALLLVQLVGLNLRAWQERQAWIRGQEALAQALTSGFPNVRAVQDAPRQAAMEIDALRAAAGRPGDGDLETLLQAAESAWPAQRPPADSLRYETGRLTLAATGWSAPEIERFRQQLRASGFEAQAGTAGVVLTPSRPGLDSKAPA